MSTNPFGKLSVKHDEEDLVVVDTRVADPNEFVKVDNKKKRKVRPDEAKKHEEQKNHQDDNEGI